MGGTGIVLPHGRASVTVVLGGLELLNEDGSDGT
jgi:hypothetical protein